MDKFNPQTRFYEFWKKKIFVDCTLHLRTENISCHKLILSRVSDYFYKLFCTSKNNDLELINIDFDPADNFKNVINYIYTGKIEISTENIIQLAAISEHYKIDCLTKIVDSHFNKELKNENTKTLLILIKQIKKLHIHRYDKAISDFLRDLLKKDSDQFLDKTIEFDKGAEITMNDVISSANSTILSNLLKDFPECYNDEILHILDLYTAINNKHSDKISDDTRGNQLSDEDKEILSSIINFDDEKIFRNLLLHQCDWIANKNRRSILSKTIDLRREKILNLEKYLDEIQNSHFGKWTCFSKFSNVFFVRDDKTPVDLINFVSSFDGVLKNPTNPYKYGLINISNTKPLTPYFDGGNIFEKDSYFAANKIDDNPPSIEFSFGRINLFKPQSILLDLININQKQPAWKPNFPINGSITVTFHGNCESESLLIEKSNEEYKIDTNSNFSSFQLAMVEQNSSGGWIFRTKCPKLVGYFV